MSKQQLDEMLSKIESSIRYDVNAYDQLCDELAKHSPFADDTVISPTNYETATWFLFQLDTSNVFVTVSKCENLWHCRFIDGAKKGFDEAVLGNYKHALYSIAVWGAYLQWQYHLEERKQNPVNVISRIERKMQKVDQNEAYSLVNGLGWTLVAFIAVMVFIAIFAK